MEELKEKSAQKEANLQRAIENTKKREKELSKIIDALQDDVASSYIVGFEAAKDQAVEDGCCPFKIVFDEDFYVHFMCILLCFECVLGSA